MSERIHPITFTRAGLIGSLAVLLIAATCVRLGFWQLSRLRQRDARNELLAARMALPSLRLESIGSDTAGMLYRKASVSGTYDHDRTIVLPGRTYRGVPGVYVLTPLMFGGMNLGVLVNRGWHPADNGYTVNFDSLRVPVADTVIGLIQPFPGTNSAPLENAAVSDSGFRRAWFRPDPVKIRAQFPYRLLGFQVQALQSEGNPQYPVALPPPTLDRGPHLGYAIQWFCFALIAIGGWIGLARKEHSRGRKREGFHPPAS